MLIEICATAKANYPEIILAMPLLMGECFCRPTYKGIVSRLSFMFKIKNLILIWIWVKFCSENLFKSHQFTHNKVLVRESPFFPIVKQSHGGDRPAAWSSHLSSGCDTGPLSCCPAIGPWWDYKGNVITFIFSTCITKICILKWGLFSKHRNVFCSFFMAFNMYLLE